MSEKENLKNNPNLNFMGLNLFVVLGITVVPAKEENLLKTQSNSIQNRYRYIIKRCCH